MDKNGAIGEVIEKAQNKTSAAASDIADSAQSQLGIKSQPSTSGVGESFLPQTERTREVVSEFYAPSEDQAQITSQTDLSEEEKLAKAREELKKYQKRHNEEYFEPLQVQSVPREEKPSEDKPREEGPQIIQNTHELPPLEEPTVKAKRGQPLWLRRKMAHTEMRVSAG